MDFLVLHRSLVQVTLTKSANVKNHNLSMISGCQCHIVVHQIDQFGNTLSDLFASIKKEFFNAQNFNTFLHYQPINSTIFTQF